MQSTEPTIDRSIIIVDDDISVNRLYQFFLKQAYNGNILSALSGDEAIRLCNTHQPEIVFMDIHMPGMSGLDTIRELRRTGFTKPIVVVTATDTISDNLTITGADRVLRKPVNQGQLIAQLELINGGNGKLTLKSPVVG
ncbi:MAG: response regulator [Candidatus Neomarinimicrobiota bacterium]